MLMLVWLVTEGAYFSSTFVFWSGFLLSGLYLVVSFALFVLSLAPKKLFTCCFRFYWRTREVSWSYR